MKKLIIMVGIFLVSCVGFEPLVSSKRDYIGQNLKTEGYYYLYSNYSNSTGYKADLFDCFILYKNGIYYNVSKGSYDTKLNISENLKKLDTNINYHVTKQQDFLSQRPNWGVFHIIGSEIEIESWVFSSGGGDYPTRILKGEIKNDSTIHFHTKLESVPLQANRKKKTFSIDETYHFRQFSPKPDSTNKFIK
jgi:hypothetical protein